MTTERYVKQIVKKVKCSGQKRGEIRRQLLADINIALQQGEFLDAVMQRMGEPAVIAEEFNQNLSDKERRRYKMGMVGKAFFCAATLIAVFVLAASWFLPKGATIESSVVFQPDQVEEKSKEVIRLLDAEDYETLRAWSDNVMKEALQKEAIDRAKEQAGPDWGKFRKFGKCYMAERTQRGKKLAVVQMNAAYENIGVTYTVVFDEEMRLAGLYIK